MEPKLQLAQIEQTRSTVAVHPAVRYVPLPHAPEHSVQDVPVKYETLPVHEAQILALLVVHNAPVTGVPFAHTQVLPCKK